MITITIAGPQGSGKNILADQIRELLGSGYEYVDMGDPTDHIVMPNMYGEIKATIIVESHFNQTKGE